ncbi:C2H2-type zinc finger transcription factor [Phycomyces blakesleeanus]
MKTCRFIISREEPSNLNIFRVDEDTNETIESWAYLQDLEIAYCRDFICCNNYFFNLHDLMYHCEECHAVKDNIPETSENMQIYSSQSAYTTHSISNKDLTVLENAQAYPNLMHETTQTMNNMPDLLSNSSSYTLSDDSSVASEKSGGPDSPQKRPVYEKQKYTNIYWWKDYLQNKEEVTRAWIQGFDETCCGSDQCKPQVEKPYKCNASACGKAYKNANGLKYHKLHGHCIEKLENRLDHIAERPYGCTVGRCTKRYKNMNGLKYHILHTHIPSSVIHNRKNL